MFHSLLFYACVTTLNAVLIVANSLLCLKSVRIMKQAREHNEATRALTPWADYRRGTTEGFDP